MKNVMGIESKAKAGRFSLVESRLSNASICCGYGEVSRMTQPQVGTS